MSSAVNMERENMLLILKSLDGGEVCDYNYNNDKINFSAKLRMKCADKEEIKYYSSWSNGRMKKFSNETTTYWIVRYTYPSAKKYVYRKVFKCQHNNFDKGKIKKTRRYTHSWYVM